MPADSTSQPTSEEVGTWVDRIAQLVQQFMAAGMSASQAQDAASDQVVVEAAASPSPTAPAAAAAGWDAYFGGAGGGISPKVALAILAGIVVLRRRAA